jgi:beta-catenin-like protein 1
VSLERAAAERLAICSISSDTDDLDRFIDSEAELDSSLKALVVTTTNPALFYPELVKNGSTSSLCNLLSHENVDITASVIELLEELTDDDVLDAGMEIRSKEEQDSSHRKGKQCMSSLLDSLLQYSLIELLVQNLSRFNDDSSAGSAENGAYSEVNIESDATAIYHLLGLVENIISLRPGLAADFLSEPTFATWLLRRMSRKGAYDQNKGFAGELLGVLMQAVSAQTDVRSEAFRLFGERGGIVKPLEVLSVSVSKSRSEMMLCVPYPPLADLFNSLLFHFLSLLERPVARQKSEMTKRESSSRMCLMCFVLP